MYIGNSIDNQTEIFPFLFEDAEIKLPEKKKKKKKNILTKMQHNFFFFLGPLDFPGDFQLHSTFSVCFLIS